MHTLHINHHERTALARVFDRNVTNAEAEAIYYALGQYVENNDTADSDLSQEEHHLNEAARAVMERMDAALAAVAEKGTEP